MEPITRRDLLQAVAVAGTVATASTLPGALAGQDPVPAPAANTASAAGDDEHHWTEAEQKDRERCIEAGFTEEEADCWELVVRAAARFFALPELHPATRGEVVQAVHVLQDKLMMRPAYRKYREVARAGR